MQFKSLQLSVVPFRVALVASTFAFIRSQPKVSARKSGQMCHQSVFQLSSLLYRSPKLSRIMALTCLLATASPEGDYVVAPLSYVCI
ncbi:hypothetical protein CEXT_576991 [Caerostris extrusa]|uniref:Secreted protein n=1 Tax=Caerostris extrusa TaxID=172846 RepID=A0AAV4MQB4_CAEEX|nr:hypothetical protein CEXT_576991 [Caerostris extrusa]